MKKHVLLSCICLLLLVSLAALPVLATTLSSTVTCSPACSCLLPAEAKKIGSSGYCKGEQKVCDHDSQKNEKYCYEKPATTTPQLIVTGYHLATTTPATVLVQKCASGCTCLSTADGKGKGLLYCGGKQTLCGGTDKAPLYCFALPTTTTTKPISLILTGFHVITTTPSPHEYSDNSFGNWSLTPIPCTAPCTCLDPDAARASGLSRCSINASLVCGYSTAGKAEYCYVPNRTTALSSAAGTTFTGTLPSCPAGCSCLDEKMIRDKGYSFCSEEKTECGRSVTGEPLFCAKTKNGSDNLEQPGNIFSAIGSFFGLFFGSPPASSSANQLVPCNGVLSNTLTDPANCGSCGNICPSGRCTMGTCTAEPGIASSCGAMQILCDGACKNPFSDANNCGSCGNVCKSSQQCCSGRCISSCLPGETCIMGGCHNTTSDNLFCGEKRDSCLPGETCIEGGCHNTTSDNLFCGEKREQCAGFLVCRNGECVCAAPFTDCRGSCVDLNSSRNNCHFCGYACDSNKACINGFCVDCFANPSLEEYGYAMCWNRTQWECVDTHTNPDNCGYCGKRCIHGWNRGTCIDGICHI